MKRVIKLHTVLNSDIYAVVFPNETSKDIIKDFEDRLSIALKSLPRDEIKRIHVQGWTEGMFCNLTNDRINAGSLVNTTTSYYFYAEDCASTTIKFDYLKQVYIDWAKTLDEKGDEDEEFKTQYAFTFIDSFKTSLLSKGIIEDEFKNVFIFYILNYEPDVPYTLSEEIINLIQAD